MEVLAFRDGESKVEHPGTHNAHPLSAAAAGIATLDLLADGSPPSGDGERRRRELRAALNDGLRAALDAGVRRMARRRRSVSSPASGRDDPVTLKRGVPEPLLRAAPVRDAGCSSEACTSSTAAGCSRRPTTPTRSSARRPRSTRSSNASRTRAVNGRGRRHDLVVVGGHVLMPATGGRRVGTWPSTTDGSPAVGRRAVGGPRRVEADGLVVAPGLIDLHVHVYDGVSHYGIDADTYLLRRGVDDRRRRRLGGRPDVPRAAPAWSSARATRISPTSTSPSRA